MKRIMAEEVERAYQETGFGISRNEFFGEDGASACGLAAYAVGLGIASKSDPTCKVSAALYRIGFELNYKQGFIRGFDGARVPEDRVGDDRYVAGYEDGQAAYAAAKEAANG